MRKYLDYNYYLNNKNIIIYIKRIINNYKYIKHNIPTNYSFKNKYLNKHQKEAIFTSENNTLVLASAGSGKTFLIEAKIDYLIKHGVNKKDILVLSFTNNSVNDLKNKIGNDIDIFTFHKLATKIISDYKFNYKITSDYLSYIVTEIFLSICKSISSKDLIFFNREITSFINLYKSYYSSSSYLDKISKKSNNKLIKLINKIYYIYEEELRSQGLIDLNDLINLSINLINKYGLKRYYKYIIIDEFQDISIIRYKLIKIIKESCNSNIFAVGDDYQSIYKFSGSNINLITKFKKYFGYTKIIKLDKTFRNSYELIKASTKFINRNKNQISKKIYSDNHINKPIKIIYYKKNMDIKLERILDLGNDYTILIRNNSDINYVLNKNISINDNKIIYNNKEYIFMTIHKSKGLEFNNIILLRLEDSLYGFPNKKEDKIKRIIVPKDKYLYEEERRLFYVSLTRSKNNVYILVNKEKPSIFIKELLTYSKKYIEELDL